MSINLSKIRKILHILAHGKNWRLCDKALKERVNY